MKSGINFQLSAGFGLCILLLITVVSFNFLALRKLDKLYHEAVTRTGEMEVTTDAQHIGEDLYQIIGNAVINRDMLKTAQLWAAGKKKNLEKLEKVASVAKTPEELALVREARAAISDIFRIYEQEMLPLIMRGEAVPGPLADIDARLDRRIESIELVLQRFARSISDESREASAEYHRVLTNTITTGLAVSLFGVLAALAVSALTTRRIVRPLSEITRATLEMEKGNYPVELTYTSNDELGVLADNFREMSRKVEKRSAELQESNGHLQREIGERKQVEEALKTLNEETVDLASTIRNLEVEIAEREKAEENVLRLNRLYAVLSETNHAIIRTKDRDTIFRDFCRIAVRDGNFKLAWVGLADGESGVVEIVSAEGATGYLEDIRITINDEPTGRGPTGISMREGTYFICNDFLGSPITRPWHARGRDHGIRAMASIALKQEGRAIGALELYADKKDFFDQQQVALLQQMGADVSFALDNIVRDNSRREAEQALREETVQRLRAMEALREKEQMLIQQGRQAAMGEMIGNIAHQWRQPLNILGLTVQQLLIFYDLGDFKREMLVKSVGSSMGLISHMSRTIDDFRNFFRPDKEKVEFKVGEAIANSLSLIEDSFKNQHIAIEVIAKADPVIFGYRNEFAQALLNILNNARDALTERVTDNPRVTITICSESGRSVIFISDNAGGIPEEIMEKIFDPYFTTKGPQLGTGVGLFMSKTIIEKNMLGKLSARNVSNGAEFRIEV
jgi:C4-dicarboxylate-specific signal transduction histidine kinase